MKRFCYLLLLFLVAMPFACQAEEQSPYAEAKRIERPKIKKDIKKKKKDIKKKKSEKKKKKKIKERNKELNKDKKYVLAIIPKGHFGEKLNKYWRAVKDTNIEDKAIIEGPPHCKLTNYFASKLAAPGFKKVLEDVLHKMRVRRIQRMIYSTGLVQGEAKNDHHDYIKLNSNFLKPFAEEFISHLKLPRQIIANKNMPFHITLRKHIFKDDKHLEKIQRLQRGLAPHKDNSSWDLGIFKKVDKKLKLIASVRIR